MKKKFLALGLSFAISALSIMPAFAFTTSDQYWYAPSSGTSGLATSTGYVSYNLTSLKYNQFKIDAIKIAKGNYHYPGLNVREDTAKFLHGSSCSSNLPNPYYDLEDDNGDGKNEEVEVVCRNSDQLTTSGTYNFRTTWQTKLAGTAYFNADAHYSARNPLTGEYNTEAYVYIDTKSYTVPASTKNNQTQDTIFNEETEELSTKNIPPEEKDKSERILLIKENKQDGYNLTAVEKKNKEIKVTVDPSEKELQNYIKYNKELAEKLAENGQSIPVVITFKKPMRTEDIEKIISGTSFKLEEFVGRAVNKENERITFAGKASSLNDINWDEIKYTVDNEKIKGLFTLYGNMNTKDLAYLQENKNIFLVDVSLIDIQKNVSDQVNGQVEVRVNHPFWYIEK